MFDQTKPRAMLRNWRFRAGEDNLILCGEVHGHENQLSCPDGLFVTTSPVVRFDLVARMAETKNTLYFLA